LLMQLLPYVAIIIAFMAIIGVGYMMGSAQVKIAKENGVAAEMLADAFVKSAGLYRDAEYARTGRLPPEPDVKELGVQDKVEHIPLVE